MALENSRKSLEGLEGVEIRLLMSKRSFSQMPKNQSVIVDGRVNPKIKKHLMRNSIYIAWPI